ncbi:MAG: hypoxanthine phosphoribosyltransferase [Thermodesulfovibrionales bacterium]|nr:hypoxanthine phosphoribosyltransferase [Thermodesulfovibrionales bacterium]
MITGKPLYTVNQIQDRVKEIADAISDDFKGEELLVIPILKGAFMFASDLVRNIKVPLKMDFIMASSYLKTDSTGEVTLHCDVRENVMDRNVLLVEDIVDTGVTLNYIRERLLQKRPRSLKICGLLDKRERREVDVPLDYIGFEIPDVFVVGYGLDYDNKYRNLPYLAVFKKESDER